jgi:hypothetical protein
MVRVFTFSPPPAGPRSPARVRPDPTVLLPPAGERAAERRLDVFEARSPARAPAPVPALAPKAVSPGDLAARLTQPASDPPKSEKGAGSPLSRAVSQVGDWLIGAGDWLQRLGSRQPPAKEGPAQVVDPVAQSRRFSALMGEADGVRSALRRGDHAGALEGTARLADQLSSAAREAPWDAELRQLKSEAGKATGWSLSNEEGRRRVEDLARHVRHASAARGGRRPLTDADMKAAAVVDSAKSAIAAARGVNPSSVAPAALGLSDVLRGQGRIAEATALETVAGRLTGAEERGDVKAAGAAREVLVRSLQAVIAATDQGGAQRARSAVMLQRLPAEMQIADRAAEAFSRGDHRTMVDLARRMSPLVAERSGPFAAREIDSRAQELQATLSRPDAGPDELGAAARRLNVVLRRAQASAAHERETMERALQGAGGPGALLPVRARPAA